MTDPTRRLLDLTRCGDPILQQRARELSTPEIKSGKVQWLIVKSDKTPSNRIG